ncbi:hypothetical protein ACVR1G_03280 [Streptococcus dentasini]
MTKKRTKLVCITLLILLLSLGLSAGIPIKGQGLQFVFSALIGIILLIKNIKAFKFQDLVLSLFFALLLNLYYFNRHEVISPLTYMLIPSYLGAMASIRRYDIDQSIVKNNLIRTLSIIIGLGTLLGGINILLVYLSGGSNFGFFLNLDNLLKSLVPGISEEIITRFVYLALVFSLLKRRPEHLIENLCTYTLMIFPHVLGHFVGHIPIAEVILLSIFFGFPLAYLQKKIDLITAIGTHSYIDLIRYIVFNA